MISSDFLFMNSYFLFLLFSCLCEVFFVSCCFLFVIYLFCFFSFLLIFSGFFSFSVFLSIIQFLVHTSTYDILSVTRYLLFVICCFLRYSLFVVFGSFFFFFFFFLLLRSFLFCCCSRHFFVFYPPPLPYKKVPPYSVCRDKALHLILSRSITIFQPKIRKWKLKSLSHVPPPPPIIDRFSF